MAAGGAGGEGDIAGWEVELFGNECAKRFVGFTIDGWGLQAHFERLALVAADFRLRCSRHDVNREASPGSIGGEATRKRGVQRMVLLIRPMSEVNRILNTWCSKGVSNARRAFLLLIALPVMS